jgi:hypothetical protein
MSKIVITEARERADAAVIHTLRQATRLSISEVQARMRSGKPICEATLFMNDHEEKARQIRDLISAHAEGRLNLRFYELLPDEEFASCSPEQCEISAQVLRSILDGHEERRMRDHGP